MHCPSEITCAFSKWKVINYVESHLKTLFIICSLHDKNNIYLFLVVSATPLSLICDFGSETENYLIIEKNFFFAENTFWTVFLKRFPIFYFQVINKKCYDCICVCWVFAKGAEA